MDEETHSSKPLSNQPPLDVLYHDGPCIVVNKPSGIATQAPRKVVGLEDLVKDYLRVRENKTGNIYVGVPHRLDRPVSGAIVFARHVRAARRLSEQFEGRLVRKVYWALVEIDAGMPLESEGTWKDFVRKIPGRAAAEVVDANHPDGKEAILHYRTRNFVTNGPDLVNNSRELRLLEIELQTGRTHQIRVQAGTRGMPVVGDEQYGAKSGFGPQTADPRERSIALHARLLEFDHPKTREPVRIEAPLPPSWRDFSIE